MGSLPKRIRQKNQLPPTKSTELGFDVSKVTLQAGCVLVRGSAAAVAWINVRIDALDS